MIVFITILATALSAFLYRVGGMGKQEAQQKIPWFPQALVNTKARDAGCPLVSFVWMLLFYTGVPWWIHLISFGAMFGFLTTYWDDMFGFDNFWFHGFMIGMAYIPYAIYTKVWIAFLLRAAVLAVFMGVWGWIFKKVDWEEGGRGGSIAATLPILRI